MKTNWIIRTSLVGLPLFGCAASFSGAGTTTTTSATVLSPTQVAVEQAIKEMTTVRCTRELSCGNIGADALEGCKTDARNATRAMLANQSCTSVVGAKLTACLEDTRNETCGPVDGMSSRLTSCRDMKLCL